MSSTLANVITFGSVIVVQAFVFCALAFWVSRRSNYFVFRRWRGAFVVAAFSVVMLDIVLLVLVAQAQSGFAVNLPDPVVSHGDIVAYVSAVSCVTVPYALVVFAGTASQLRRGFDSWIGMFDWVDRVWRNPYGSAKENRVAIRDDRRF